MAFQRTGAGALALSSHALHRRRRALRRALLKSRAENTSTITPQAIIIGPGGTTDLEPVFAGGQGSADLQGDGDDNNPASGSLQSNISPPVAVTRLPYSFPSGAGLGPDLDVPVTQATSSPNAVQAAPSIPVASPRPSSASSAPSLVTNIVTQSTFGDPNHTGSIQVVGITLSTVVPTSSSTSDAFNSSVPVSQSPPVIFAIILAAVLAIAAVAAVVSWILRAQRRRYNNHLADLGLDGNSLENAFNEPAIMREKDIEAGIPDPMHGHVKIPEHPLYVEPRADAYDREMYPSESHLAYHSPRQNDPYYPALQVTNLAPGDLSVEGHAHIPHVSPAYPPPPAVFSDLGVKETLQRSQDKDSELPWRYEDRQHVALTSSHYLTSYNKANPTVTEHHPNPDSSWRFAFPPNVVSALDAVRQAAGDRLAHLPPWSGRSKQQGHEKGIDEKDRFTPLALRPGRKSISGMPIRRGTQEEKDLSFGGKPTVRRRESARGHSGVNSGQSTDTSGDDTLEKSEHSARLDDLGTFSFEGRSRTPSQGGKPVGVRKKNERTTRSTRLYARDSVESSTSTATTRSGSGPGVGASGFAERRMRRRKSRQPGY